MPITTCIFDAYGTLFDVGAAARVAATEPGFAVLAEAWPQLAHNWRQKQLEYTWLRAIAGRHADFWQVTQDGLDWAMESANLAGNAPLRARLLELYRSLAAYPEVTSTLTTLRAQGLRTGILSNGSPEMLNAAVTHANISALLDKILSVESVSVFKPHDRVYDLVGNHFGCDRSEVLFVSSNGWDACGAAGYGFETAWINRTGAPMDKLYAQPRHVLPDLSSLPELL